MFTPPSTWRVCPLPAPASTPEEWLAKIKTMNKRTPFWRNKRLAHIFDDGWDMATFQGRERDRLIFFYATDQSKWAHSLDFDEHGISKSWVILEKST